MTQLSLDDYLKAARFEGPPDNAKDFDRLCGQIRRVYECMKSGRWLTLAEIEMHTGDPQASISAQLRHLRRARFGGHIIEKQRRFIEGGTWEYKLIRRTS